MKNSKEKLKICRKSKEATRKENKIKLMDMEITFNYLAIISAAVASFILGGIPELISRRVIY